MSSVNKNYPYEVPTTLEMAVVILAASSFQIRDFVNMIVFLDSLKSHDKASSLSDLSSQVKVHIPISV